MGKRLYLDTLTGVVDYTRWADFATLDNATLTAGQGVVETFKVGLRNYAPLDEHSVGGPLPALPTGTVPFLYIDVPGSFEGEWPLPTPPFGDYDVLFSGIMLSVDGSDGDWQGMTQITVATPMKQLKIIVHSIVFRPDVDLQPTDTSRIRNLGAQLAGQLPNWDFDTYVSADLPGNITYPLPSPVFALHLDGTDADDHTSYQELTIEAIIRNIATDPGDFLDANYPVQARNWWIESDFVAHGDPSTGIKHFFHYQDVPVPDTVIDLLGQPDPALPDAVFYEQGSQYTIDYTKVVRQVSIAGYAGSPGTYTYVPQLVTSFNIGTFDRIHNRGNILWKAGGTDGVWDAAGGTGYWDRYVTPNKFYGFAYDDVEMSAQLQEIYLEHDTFQRPAGPPTGVSATGVQGGLGQTLHYTWWNMDNEAGQQPMHVRKSANTHVPGNVAASEYALNPVTNLGANAFGVLECGGASVILRTHLAVNRTGATLMFHYQDYYHWWGVRAEAGGYSVVQANGGAPAIIHSISMARTDWPMQEIKVAIKNEGDPPYGSRAKIEVYIDNVLKVAFADDYLAQETRHGFNIDCTYAPEAFDAEFYDFQCTTFYGDRAFGLGDYDMSFDAGDHYANPTWEYIGYGCVFNSDGTTDLVVHGNPLDHDEWEPLPGFPGQTLYDTQRGYLYNDRYKVLVVKYVDPADMVTKRKAQWQKQPNGEGIWTLLAEKLDITDIPGPSLANPWAAQIAFKDNGSALVNVSAGRNYSNTFFAPDTYSVLYGGNGLYPATDVVSNPTWQTYAQRQRVADAIFRAEAEPALTFTCTTMHQFKRGDFAKIGNRRAGWVDDATKPVLMCTSVRRAETSNRRVPKYACSFGRYKYASDDPGRTHLLQPGTKESLMYDVANQLDPEFDGLALLFEDSAVLGMQNLNQQIQTQLIPQDQVAAQSTMWPINSYEPGTKRAMLPVSWFPPGTKLIARHRVISAAGVSDWSKGLPFTTPPQVATDRASVCMWYIGNGTDPIATADVYDEVQVNQPCRIIGWAADLGDIPGDIVYDVQWCSAANRRANGPAAFTSIVGGTVPFIDQTTPINDGTFNDGFNIVGWADVSQALQTGDRLRLVITSATTTATKGTFDLMFAANPTSYTQQAGVAAPGHGVGGVGGDPTAGEIVGDDNQPLVGDDGQDLAGEP